MPLAKALHVRPFAKLAAEARDLGFELLYHDDGEAMRPYPGPDDPLALTGSVSIRLEPKTIAAKEALRRSSDDPLCDGFEATTVYKLGIVDPINDPHQVATEDTAVYALRRARDALRHAQPE